MIIWLLELFSYIPAQRLVSYISFRSLMAVLTSFLIGVFFGPNMISNDKIDYVEKLRKSKIKLKNLENREMMLLLKILHVSAILKN